MTTNVRLAIVGSTEFENDPLGTLQASWYIGRSLIELMPALVISGGAPGIDTLAAEMARAADIEVKEHFPKHKRWAPEGFKDRNLLIAQDCTHLLRIAHPDSTTYGSGWTADQAESMGRIVERIHIKKRTFQNMSDLDEFLSEVRRETS